MQATGAPEWAGSLIKSVADVNLSIGNFGRDVRALTSRVDSLESAPTRTLPDRRPPAEEPPPVPRIEVHSKYRDRTFFGMLFEDELRASRAHVDRNYVYSRDKEWWGAFIDKTRVLWEKHEFDEGRIVGYDADDEPIRSIQCNPLSQASYDTLHARVPYLHADEAMRSDLTSYGLELVPTMFRDAIYFFFRAQSRVLSLFESFKPTSGPTFYMPTWTSGPVFRKVPELSDDVQMSRGNSPIPSSKLGTDQIPFVAGKIGARTLLTEELELWSAGDTLEGAARLYAQETAAQIDWVLMNGDETDTAANISNIGTAPSGTIYDKLLVVDGLRHMSQVTVTADSKAEATIAITTPAVGAAQMGGRGRIGDDIERVVMIACPESARKFYGLTNYQSIADVGRDRATLLHGQVGAVAGYDLVADEAVELGDANGAYDDTHAAGTVGQIVFAHRDIIKVAMFKPPNLNTEWVPHAGTYEMLTSVIMDINQLEVGGTASLYNNTV